MTPKVLAVSLHSAEPEQVQLDLEALRVWVTPDLDEAGALLEFESKAYSGMDDLPAPFSLGGYNIEWMTISLAVLVVILLASNLLAYFFLHSLRLKVKKLDNSFIQPRKGLGMTDANNSTT